MASSALPGAVVSASDQTTFVVASGSPESAAAIKGASTGSSREYTADEHMLTLQELADRFDTHIAADNAVKSRGLSATRARELLATHGPNVLSPPPTQPEWLKFVKHFGHLLLVLLELASLLGFIAYGLNGDRLNLILGLVLLVLVLLTGIMNYLQERSASDVLASIQGMLPAQTRVIRDGQEFLVPAAELVPGDLVRLTIGARVPADIRLIYAADCKVEMASLTGESDAIECGPERKSDVPAEARNLIFNSTLVMSGECTGVVIKTGDNTMIGSIAGLAGGTGPARMTTMEREVRRVVFFISGLAILTACIFFAVGMSRGLGLIFCLVNAFILVLVANVPEGLPATVTSILQLTATTLARHNILIKRTDLIETLGCCTVIASDKTGTLTQNRMTVENVWVGLTFHRARVEIKRGAVPGGSPGLLALPVPSSPSTRSSSTRPSRAESTADAGADSPRMTPALSGKSGGIAGGAGSPPLDPLAGMTIGRGMSFLSLGEAGPVAVIHSTTGTAAAAGAAGGKASAASSAPGSPQQRTLSERLMGTIGRASGMSLASAAAGSGAIMAPADLKLPPAGAKSVGKGSRMAGLGRAGPGARPKPSNTPLAAIFDRDAQGEQEGEATPTIAAAPAAPAPPKPATADHGHTSSHSQGSTGETGDTGASSGEEGEDEDGEAEPAPAEPRPDTGLRGSDLILTGFTGPLMDVPAPDGLARVAVTEHMPSYTAVAASSPRHGPLHAQQGKGKEGADPTDVAVAVEDWAGSGKKGAATMVVMPPASASGDTGGTTTESAPSAGLPIPTPPLAHTGSFMQHVSFQSFRGFTKVVWAHTNAFSRVCTIAAVCNKAAFSADGPVVDEQTAGRKDVDRSAPTRPFPPGVDSRPVLGDASDAALLRYMDGLAPIFEWRAAYPVLFEIPFNSAAKWSLAITPCPEDPTSHLVFMKGAPERIVQRCSHHFYDGGEVPIDDVYLQQWAAAYERFGIMGERVLGFAYAKIPARSVAAYKSDATSYPLTGLVFAGLVSLVDPPKPGTAEAVAICKGAGVRVTMVTGDHPLTAEAIARKVGIVTQPTVREVAASLGVAESSISLSDPRVGAAVIAGYDIPALTQADWDAIIAKQEVVFARTSPQQKLQIVEQYQAAGHVVAVTGDGTNDAPALKKADIGVAMGSANASDVARDAADLIILDDNFASIVQAITIGRCVFENIKKTIAYTITHLWPELIPVLATLVLDVPIMLTGLLILLVDCVTEQGPAISLTYEPAEASVMSRPPRNVNSDRLVDAPLLIYSYLVMGLAQCVVCTLAFCSIFMTAGVPLSTIIYNPAQWQEGSPALLLPDGRSLDGHTQAMLYRTAVAAYFLNLVMCQAWHIFLTKTRRLSIFSHEGFNTLAGVAYTGTGVLAALAVLLLVVYVPGVQEVFGTAAAPGIAWTPHLAYAAYALAWTEAVKAGARREEARGEKGWITRWLAW